jgi:hypothetical protein
MIVTRLIEARQQVSGSGTGGSGAHAQASGELGLARRRQCSALLMAYSEPRDAFVAANGIRERIQCIAHDAEDLARPQIGKRGRE